MNREMIETAKKEGLPFSLTMANGREFKVKSGQQIHLTNTHVVLVDEQTFPHVLPLPSISRLSYLKRPVVKRSAAKRSTSKKK